MFQLPAEAVEPEFVGLLDYWRAKLRDGRLPGRRDIDPLDLPRRILPNLLLFDVERTRDDLRFRFRLAGTGFATLIGREATGRYFDEIAPDPATDPVLGALRTIVATRQPVFLAGPLTVPRSDYAAVKRLGVPLAEDGETVDMVLASFLPVARAIREDGRVSAAAE